MALRWQIAALTFVCLCVGASAQVPLSSLDTTVAVQNDGSAIVVERFAPLARGRFIWRAQNAFPGAFGVRKPRTVEIIDVTDGDGQKLSYTPSNTGNFLELAIEAGAAAEIKVSYSVSPEVRFLGDRDELLWHAGEHWAGSVQRSSVLVQLPEAVAEQFRAQGSYIADSGVKVVPALETKNSAQVECGVRLSPGHPCTVDVIFPTGLLTEASAWKQAAASLSVNPIFVLPIVVLALIVGIQLYRMRRVTPTYAPQYEPPDGLTPAEVGVIIDDKLDPRDVVATIVDLAVRGYVRMEECQPDEGVSFQGQDYILRSIRTKDSWSVLAPHERTALFHIFYGGEWTKLSSLYQRFYSIVPVIREDVFALLRKKGTIPVRSRFPGHASTAAMGRPGVRGRRVSLHSAVRRQQELGDHRRGRARRFRGSHAFVAESLLAEERTGQKRLRTRAGLPGFHEFGGTRSFGAGAHRKVPELAALRDGPWGGTSLDRGLLRHRNPQAGMVRLPGRKRSASRRTRIPGADVRAQCLPQSACPTSRRNVPSSR